MIPFLVGHAPGELELETELNPLRRRNGQRGWIAGLMSENLRLWGYSREVDNQLRRHLPHSVESVEALPVESAWFAKAHADGVRYDPISASIQTWNIGVGLVTLMVRLQCDERTTWSGIRKALAARSTKNAILDATTDAIRIQRREPREPLPLGKDSFFSSPGTPLWVQEVFVVETHNGDAAELSEVARVLSNGGALLALDSHASEVVVRLGVEVCCATRDSEEGRQLTGAVGRVVAAQTAIWAASIEVDFALARELRSSQSTKKSLRSVQDESVKLLKTYEIVRRFAIGVETLPLHLSTLDKMIWRAVDREWEWREQLKAVSDKLNAIEHLYAHLATTMSNRSARFINIVVTAITMLSLGTFALTAWEFIHKQFGSLRTSNLSLVLAAVGVSVCVFLVMYHKYIRAESLMPSYRRSARLGLRDRGDAAPE